jgi:hypothetical protein
MEPPCLVYTKSREGVLEEEALDEAQVVRPAINLTRGGTPHGATFSEGLGFCSITASLRSHLQRAGLGLKVFNSAAPDNNKKRTWFAKATSRAIIEIASKMKSKLSATASMMFAMSTSETLLILYRLLRTEDNHR